MDDINLTCEIHNCPIGGVCSDLFCEGVPLMCIKCAIDDNFCIRKMNHELITFEEFFKIYKKKFEEKMFINKKLTPSEFLKFLAYFKSEEINSKFKDKIDFVNGFTKTKLNNYKKDIYDNAIDKVVLNRQKCLSNDIKEVDEIINLINEFKELSFLPDNKAEFKNFYNKFDDISCRFQDANLLNKKNLIKLFEGKIQEFNVENEIDEIEENEDNTDRKYNQSDYKNMNQLVKLLKFLENESKNKKHIIAIEKSNELLSFYKNKMETIMDFSEERERHNQLLLIVEKSIRNLVKTKKIDIDFYIEKKFEYVGNEKQNLCKKLNLFCEIQYLDKSILSHISNNLVQVFTAKNFQKYLIIFSSNLSYSLLSLLPKQYNSKITKMKLEAPNNTKILLKIEYFQTKENDIIITQDSNKRLNFYKVDYSNLTMPKLNLLDGMSIKSNDFWTVEKVEDAYYLITSNSKEYCISTISNNSLITFDKGQALGQISGFIIYKDTFTQKFCKVICQSPHSYYIQEKEDKSSPKLIKCEDIKNHPIIHKIHQISGQNDYQFISCKGKTIFINNLKNGNIKKKIFLDEEIESMDLLDKIIKNLLFCKTKKKLIFLDLEIGEEISNYLISKDIIVKVFKESLGFLKITDLGNIKIYN